MPPQLALRILRTMCPWLGKSLLFIGRYDYTVLGNKYFGLLIEDVFTLFMSLRRNILPFGQAK